MKMETIAYFENIPSHLENILNNAKSEIVVAVPWFTDRKLFAILCQQARKGLRVQLLFMDDDINRNGGISFQQLEESGGDIFKVPEGGRLMHNKFAVIDHQTVVTGSYNWSNKAQTNDENITVITGNLGLAAQYIETYQKMLRSLGYQSVIEPVMDARAINLRLQAIRNLIDLEEMDVLTSQVKKLHGVDEDDELQEIITCITARLFDKAKRQITRYLESHQQLAQYVDPEINQLEMLLQALEINLKALSDQKVEMERKIISFDQLTTENLGKVIEEYLRLRSEVLKKTSEKLETTAQQQEAKKAKDEYEEYQKEYEEVKEECIAKLDDKEQKELKKLYRKASRLCHPDMVDAENKKMAQEVFTKLNEAYKKNDPEAVATICAKLESGQLHMPHRKAMGNKTLLETRIKELQKEVATITGELVAIYKSATYQKIISIDDYEEYFVLQREQLQAAIAELEEELAELSIKDPDC